MRSQLIVVYVIGGEGILEELQLAGFTGLGGPVFFTSEGKGCGLRTLEELPKGAFVCEFVGEILTVKELHERNIQCAQNGTYTYPVLLDADWCCILFLYKVS